MLTSDFCYSALTACDSVSWVTSALGASCDAACAAKSKICDPVCLAQTNTEDAATAALAAAGGFKALGTPPADLATCPWWDSSDSTEADYPGYDLAIGGCFFASSVTSTCAAYSSAASVYRICACTGTDQI